jgi:DNA polymerase-3 subunit gamma/tau
LGTAAGESVYEVIDAILDENAGQGIALVNRALDNGSDPRQFARQLVDLLRALLMVRMGNVEQLEATPEEQQKMRTMAERFSLDKLLAAIRAFDHAAQQTSLGWQPGLQLELALTSLTTQTIQPSSSPAKQENPPASPQKQKEAPQKADPAPRKPAKTQESAPRPQADQAGAAKQSVGDVKETAKVEPEEVSTPLQAGQPVAARPAGEGDIGLIQDKWKEIRLEARKISPETAALLNSCRSVSTHKGRLVLSFATDFVRSKMENGQNLEKARQAVHQVTGVDIEIDCRVAGQEESEFPEGIDRDGMVGTALSLGGKITKKE